MSESTILVVDDEAAIRDMVGITLDLAGFNSLSAANAHDAHVSIIDHKPDLVLLDWMLPGGSGIELARRLRRDEITANIPIIMLTAKVLRVFDLQLDPTSHRISIEDKPVEMGPTEFRLLKFFLLNQEKVFSRDHIQDSVWGGNVYLEERTIDVHIRRLRKALSSIEGAAIDYAKLIQTVRGAGYRFSVRPS